MFPLLFEIPILGGIRIYTYGVLVAISFVAGIFWSNHEAKLEGVSTNFIMDLAFYLVLSGLIGGRLLYIIVDWQRYAEHLLDVFKIWEGGLVFYGGLIAALLTGLCYVRKKKLGFLRGADIFMPGLALGHAIGRLGCFAAGCCYGREAAHFPLSVTFPMNRYSLAPAGIPLLPSQLFEVVAELLIFALLILVRRHKRFEGQIFLIYIVLYSLSRSYLETLRGDSVRGFLIPHVLSTSQFISGCLILVAIFVYVHLRKKSGRIS